MKTLKSLLMLCAGLSFCACSSDNEPQFPEGTGMVEVKIVPPQTRSIVEGSSDGTIEITGNITVTLYATFVAADGTESTPVEGRSVTLTSGNTAKFWNVKAPNRVTASVNNGKSTYADVSIVDFNPQEEPIAPTAIPAYGEGTPVLTDDTQSPDLNGSDDNVNANQGDNNKAYQVYSVTVPMKIPVARLEVSGITLSSSTYSSLTLAGAYLDYVRPLGPSWYTNGTAPLESAFDTYANDNVLKDYAFSAGVGTGEEALLKDAGAAELVGKTLPADSKSFAYYFYGAPSTAQNSAAASYNPMFKLYFNDGESTETVSFPRFAFIRNFTDQGGNTIVLKNGHIYKIVAATAVLQDENIIGDESGNTLFGVDVTVQEASWSVETIKASWAN